MKKNDLFFAMLVMVLVFGVMVFGCFDDSLPSPPTNVLVMWLDRNRVQITWDEVPGAKMYEVAFRTNLESSSTRRNIGTAHITSYTHTIHPSIITNNVSSLHYYIRAGSHTSPSASGYKATAWVEANSWANTGNPGAPDGGGMDRPPQ